MSNIFRFLVWFAGWAVLSLRYRVEVKGLEKVRGLKKAIILPNHPAYMDPPVVIKTIWPALRPRPLLLADVFKNPLVFWLPWALDAVQIPDLQQHSTEARKQTQEAIKAVAEGLHQGKNHILWPSGHVYHQGKESLGAARSLAEILAEVPDAEIIVIRTRGMWGSMFSFAYTGKRPHLLTCLCKGIGILLANLLFFTPRRRISMTVEKFDRQQLPGLSREQINPLFDAWYNAPGEEEPKFVRYHFLFGRRSHVYPPIDDVAKIDLGSIRPRTKEQVGQFIAEKLQRELQPSEQDGELKLEELGLDSLDRMELALEVERRFGFASSLVPTTIGELWALAEGQLQNAPTVIAPPAWFKKAPRETAVSILADTIPEAFVKRALYSGKQVAVADDISGVLTYERLLVAALLMSRRIAAMPGDNIGLMLPAGVGMDVLFFASHLAGKLPVLLNWTTGPANLAHAVQVMGLSRVITSKRFLDRVGVTIEGTQYVFVEEVRAEIGKGEMLATLLRIKLMPDRVLRSTPQPDPDSPATVLFTSGSEKAPKAVPLTHANIISNIRAGLDAFAINTNDVLMGFLPSFHSFGLTVTTVLPVLVGVRVVYHPDPTDSAAIARKIGKYGGTIFCGTPTFVSYIMDRSLPGELDSVRIAVVGAEKCPDAVYRRAAERMPHTQLLEGYGITECSPLVSCNRLERHKAGSIGLPFPGVTVRAVDMNTHEPVSQGEMGMLLVAGPGVFPGYIGEGANPFIEKDGRRWYETGDLGKLDEDGFIWFLGRLKRFLKAGGEMISLPAIEEPLASKYPPTDTGPRVAVEGVESPEGRQIVLFTTEAITLREANEILQQKGLRGIMRLDEVRQLEKLPVLGTGKTDYKVLRKMITDHPGVN